MFLEDWTPKKILEVSNDPAGFIVDDELWNARWNLHREQGDDTAQTVYDLITNLNSTVCHATDGAASLTHPAPEVFIPDDIAAENNVGAQIDWLSERAGIFFATLSVMNDAIQARREKSVAITHEETTGRDSEDCHPIGAITNLQATLDAIVAGNLEAVNHNLLPSRDAEDAHPMAAITGLSAFKEEHDDLITAYTLHNHNSNTLVHGTGTIAAKFSAIDATIAALTGDITEIVHNDLASRDAVNAHPVSSITGLQAALDAKLATATAATVYQTKILHGTNTPSNLLGNDGDIYIRLGTPG